MTGILTEANSIPEALEAAGTDDAVAVYAADGPWLVSCFNNQTDCYFEGLDTVWDLWGDLERFQDLKGDIVRAASQAFGQAHWDTFWTHEAAKLLTQVRFTQGFPDDALTFFEMRGDERGLFGRSVAAAATYILHELYRCKEFTDEVHCFGGRALSIDAFLRQRRRVFLPGDRYDNDSTLMKARSVFLTAFILRALTRKDQDRDTRITVIVEGAQSILLPDVYERLYSQGARAGLRLIITPARPAANRALSSERAHDA